MNCPECWNENLSEAKIRNTGDGKCVMEFSCSRCNRTFKFSGEVGY